MYFSDTVNSNSSILSSYAPANCNGRINVLSDTSDPAAQFKMFERVAVRNKATDYRGAVNGVWEETQLSRLFFSADNIQILQNGIRAGVYRMSDQTLIIPPQGVDHLKVIMRSIYVENARHLKDGVTRQIEELNDLILDYCVPFVYKECISYVYYLRDQSTLVVPLERELPPDRDHKQLELAPFI